MTGIAGLCQLSEEIPRHTVTLGFGVGSPQGRFAQYDRFLTRPALLMDYEFRLHRYFAADAGVDLVFRADNDQCFAPRGCPPPKPGGQAWLVPFGARVLVPVRSDSIELFVGGGGAKASYEYFQRYLDNGWGGQANAGFRIRFGASRRWHAGFLGRYYRIPNRSYLKEQWFTLFGSAGVAF